MLKFSVEVKENPKFKEEFVEKMQKILLKSMFKMQELAVRFAPVDTGELRQKIKVIPKTLSSWYELQSNAKHSADVEFGSRPFYVPLKPLLEWVERKGIRTTESGQYAFAKYVQKKIKEKGTNAQPFMRPARDQVVNYWIDVFTKEEFS